MSVACLAGQYGITVATGHFHEVVPHRIYRSGQPSSGQLRAWIDRYGLKTIIDLRGPDSPRIAADTAIARSMGVDMVCVRLSAYRLMRPAELVRLIEELETARQPLLLHCGHGVDRSGTASAIAAWLLAGEPYRHAKRQAYVPPGPWKRRHGRPHISDTLTVYEAYCRDHAVNPDNPDGFRYWARYVYPLADAPLPSDSQP